MKRCENCGYENTPQAERCEKCGARLGAAASPAQPSQPDPEPVGGKKTIKGQPVNRPFLDGGNETPQPKEELNAPDNCPKCSYPIRPGASTCPNCGYQLATGSASAPAGGKKTVALGDFSAFGDTVKPRFELVSEKEQKTVEFSGEEVTLNRDKLDPENMTISGGEHAKISFREGKWHIEDLSSNGATFVQVNRATEIQDGDLIILGQKIFRFKAK